LNDKNCVLIESYLHIRDDLNELILDLSKIEKEYYSLLTLEEKAEYYYEQRKQFNLLNMKSLHRSALFIFLNKTGYNGMYRENSSGGYNIPFGKRKQPIICDKENLKLVSDVLKQIDVKCGSYEDALTEAVAGDFIYLDPPYEPLNRTSNFTEYQAGGFVQEDQRKLAEIYRGLSEKGCLVMMSNSTAKLIYELYSEYFINKITVSRGINATKSIRGKIEELIITNYEPIRGLYLSKHNGSKQ
jgi:DNA adenine methylase